MTPLTEKQLVEIVDKAIKDFQGHCDSLSGAIGYLMIGRKLGWRVMFFMHSQALFSSVKRSSASSSNF